MPNSAEVAATNRRADVVGIHSLDHFSLSVPDLAQAQAFYTAFGLDVRNAPHGFDLRTAGHAHRWGTYREGRQKKLGRHVLGSNYFTTCAIRGAATASTRTTSITCRPRISP
jgi:hypothetical protein